TTHAPTSFGASRRLPIGAERTNSRSFPFCSFPFEGKGDRRRKAAVEEVNEGDRRRKAAVDEVNERYRTKSSLHI
ncbi:MAG: hypothetical protein II536_05040, partial [Clostridia bacterium]|nr:hypothetical protein [Clostridia bacterium]